MNKKEFIEKIAPLVQAENKKREYPLFSSVVIAQAACESAYGQSKLMMKANAIFGIKATENWNGKIYNSKTQECWDGSTYTNITAYFRAYNTIEESISDYFDLITKNTRYRKACIAENPRECITAIKNGGYATDPNYIETIMSIINNNNLTQYDNTINIEQIACDVINGKYGNGEERKNKLGALYEEVQKKVNELIEKNDITYTVKKGDTLIKIAKKYNKDYKKIAEDNKIKNPNKILIGQKLVIK